jgi:hypothetical protein
LNSKSDKISGVKDILGGFEMARTRRAKTTKKRAQTLSYGTSTHKKWIQGALKGLHKGLLHEELGLKPKQKIPSRLLAKAAKSKNPTIRRQAILAETLNRFHHH